jgi:hypothetical protein
MTDDNALLLPLLVHARWAMSMSEPMDNC